MASPQRGEANARLPYSIILYFCHPQLLCQIKTVSKKNQKKYLLKQIKAPPGQKAESLKKSCCLTTFIPNQ
jgi:hypothetical protein